MTARVQEQQAVARACNDQKLGVQQVLEFFGQEAVARVVRESPRLHDPAGRPGEGRPSRRSAPARSFPRKRQSNMGLVSRFGNLWRGFLSLWISDIEKQHPEIAYENAINSMVEKYSQLKTATAAIIRRREDIDERVQQATKELAQTEAELDAAVETNQDDLALVLIQKKNQLAADMAELKTELDTAPGGRRLARRRRSSACRARFASSRPSATRCWRRCSRRRRASASASSSMACRSTPK